MDTVAGDNQEQPSTILDVLKNDTGAENAEELAGMMSEPQECHSE